MRLIGGFHDPWSMFGEATGEHPGSHERDKHTCLHDGRCACSFRAPAHADGATNIAEEGDDPGFAICAAPHRATRWGRSLRPRRPRGARFGPAVRLAVVVELAVQRARMEPADRGEDAQDVAPLDLLDAEELGGACSAPGAANPAGAGAPKGPDVPADPPETVPAAGDLTEAILATTSCRGSSSSSPPTRSPRSRPVRPEERPLGPGDEVPGIAVLPAVVDRPGLGYSRAHRDSRARGGTAAHHRPDRRLRRGGYAQVLHRRPGHLVADGSVLVLPRPAYQSRNDAPAATAP